MTETDLEDFISKAVGIGLNTGNYSIFFPPDIPGRITLNFPKELADELVEFSKYFREALYDFEKKLNIKQVAPDKIDITLMVVKEPAIILVARDLQSRKDVIENFFNKQPNDKPLLLFPVLIEDVETMMYMSHIDPDHHAIQPIQITFWSGCPLGTSSGDLTNFI